MLHLIPQVKHLELKDNYLISHSIYYNNLKCDKRIINALNDFPFDKNGVILNINIKGDDNEAYELTINENNIDIKADGPAGAFYAIQTLKQIFKEEKVPCLYIKDYPDFKYRGFYHDITRGKIPKLASIKSIIDNMAYYKLNSLQLYVEHVYPFKEYADLGDKFGYITGDELKAIDEYCYENFIEFIPSLSTFGHLFELLNQEEYSNLRVLKDYKAKANFWADRMGRHTLDPTNPKCIELIKSILDQYIPNFKSKYFNICCDETFDLNWFKEHGQEPSELYVKFVNQIIDYVKSKGKTAMMWGDILLEKPESIKQLPEDIIFLNWDYDKNPKESKVTQFAKFNRTQIVCPGTSTWNRFCENIDISENNISLMAEYGYKHGAIGVLNTNWGDWGNPCSIELSMYGFIVGAEKSWSVSTEINDDFQTHVNYLLYENPNAFKYLYTICELHKSVSWMDFARFYFAKLSKEESTNEKLICDLESVQKVYTDISSKLSTEIWKNDEYRKELLIAAEGLCVIAELGMNAIGRKCSRITNTYEWLTRFSESWLAKNKPSELYRIQEMFEYFS